MTEGQRQTETTKSAGRTDAAAMNRDQRRRLLKAAAMAAPLLVTLHAKPAHATAVDQQSLGSVGILYGPGAYVTQQDVTKNSSILKNEDIGKSVKIENGKKKVLVDKTRRDQNSVETTKDGGPKAYNP